jgi:hypothetical protein
MVGKITTVLAKKEAEAYCAQGLHQEAMNLFSGLLASSRKMDPAIEAAIKSQLQGIREEMQDADAHRRRALCPEEIRRIRDGWGENATETDTLVCAQAFYQLGSYGEALWELKKLLQGRNSKRIHITAAADCLMQLHLPEQLPVAAEAFVRELHADDKAVWAMLVVMAKHMESAHHKAHALALYLHLALIPELAPSLQPRIKALSGLPPEPGPAAPLPEPAPEPQAPTPAAPAAPGRFSLKRLAALFRKRPA